MSVIEHRPHLVTHLPAGIEVSSIDYDIKGTQQNISLNETCVFYPNGDSDILGTYDDHNQIVAGIRAKLSATTAAFRRS